jgi:hypothetical protein
MSAASWSLRIVLVTVAIGACGDGASGQVKSAAVKSAGAASSCPSAGDVSTAAGFPVTLKAGTGSQDSFDCVYEITGRYRGTTMELTGNPASMADGVFRKVKQSAKIMNGQQAEAERIDAGSGGWAYGGDAGNEAAAADGGHVYHATLSGSVLSSIGNQKDALVRLLKRMVQMAPAGQRTSAPPSVCTLATSAEFDRAFEGSATTDDDLSSDPVATDMSWGPHCDYDGGSIDLFQTKPQTAALERVLGLMEAGKQPRVPVSGLGQQAFFTVIYPDDKYRRRGFLAVYTGPRIVSFSMDAKANEAIEATRPKLEVLARLVLPRLESGAH